MKTVMTTLIVTMLITGCAEKERYAERYLDTISLVIHINRPADVTGFLKQGESLWQAVEYSDLTGISRLSLTCDAEDSIELLNKMPDIDFPFEVSTETRNGGTSVEYWQEGITWQPVYEWNIHGDSCFFTANVRISNSTGREWFSRNVIMKDVSENPVCGLSDTLILRNGDMDLGWWAAGGEVLPLTLRYGWPLNSQWNQLVPCIVPEAGKLVDGIETWPARTRDTLWVHPEKEIEITETVNQASNGYDCFLQIHNQTGEYTEIRITHPETTPRGAKFQEGEKFQSFLGLQPGDVVIMEYRILYSPSP